MRIRTVKPEFFRHERLQDLEADNPGQHIMLVFMALWLHCDAAGTFRLNPRTMKLDILPFLEFDIARTLEILIQENFVIQFEANGNTYGHIPSFTRHQRITGKEATDGIKHPKPPQTTTGKQPGNNRETTGKQPGAQEGKGKERKGKESGSYAHAHEAAPDDSQNEKNADDTRPPLSAFSAVHAQITEWGESDSGHAEIIEWKKITGYRDSVLGPTTDELTKFISYHLSKAPEQEREALIANPIEFFRLRFPGWLTNAKTMNRPPQKSKPPPNAAYYTPPPNQRNQPAKTGPTPIATIIKPVES